MRRGDEKKTKVERFGVNLEKNLEIDTTFFEKNPTYHPQGRFWVESGKSRTEKDKKAALVPYLILQHQIIDPFTEIEPEVGRLVIFLEQPTYQPLYCF